MFGSDRRIRELRQHRVDPTLACPSLQAAGECLVSSESSTGGTSHCRVIAVDPYAAKGIGGGGCSFPRMKTPPDSRGRFPASKMYGSAKRDQRCPRHDSPTGGWCALRDASQPSLRRRARSARNEESGSCCFSIRAQASLDAVGPRTSARLPRQRWVSASRVPLYQIRPLRHSFGRRGSALRRRMLLRVADEAGYP